MKKKAHYRKLNKLVKKWDDSPPEPPIKAIKTAIGALDFYLTDWCWPEECDQIEKELTELREWVKTIQ